MEVGYSSLSHFSKAFCTTIGCCPTLFPSAKALVAKFQTERKSREGRSTVTLRSTRGRMVAVDLRATDN